MHQIVLISGPPAAGRSAVARALCERFDRMLHVDVDVLRSWVVAGYRHPRARDEQALEQRLLAIRNASAIARECSALRYACLIDDTALAADLEAYREALAGAGAPLHAVTLLPSREARREGAGGRAGGAPEEAGSLHAAFAREAASGLLPGVVLDTSRDRGAHYTADRVQDAVASGESLVVGERPTPR
ncbi:MAG: AAA family ATPase [Chloroflexi bacterium]|nr:AAA family ATPase [Chloroflexota bacterium]